MLQLFRHLATYYEARKAECARWSNCCTTVVVYWFTGYCCRYTQVWYSHNPVVRFDIHIRFETVDIYTAYCSWYVLIFRSCNICYIAAHCGTFTLHARNNEITNWKPLCCQLPVLHTLYQSGIFTACCISSPRILKKTSLYVQYRVKRRPMRKEKKNEGSEPQLCTWYLVYSSTTTYSTSTSSSSAPQLCTWYLQQYYYF